MRAPLLLLLLAMASAAQAQHYFTDTFASYNSGAWSYPGGSGLNFGGGGLTADGSIFVNKLIAYNNGGNTAQHEVKATFNGLPSGPWYVSADLYLTTNWGGTSGYKIALKNGCFTVYEMSGGSLYTLSTGCFSYTGATTVRAIKTAAGIRVAIGQEVFWTPGASYGGWQGVGIGSNGGGYAITQAQLAPGDLTAPNNVSGLTGQGTPTQADLSWSGAVDNAGGSGLLRYNVYRNSVLIGSTFGTTYTDNAVSPGTTYTYTVKSEDYHANEASGVNVSVQTGSSGNAPDPHAPRQTGVRPLGS